MTDQSPTQSSAASEVSATEAMSSSDGFNPAAVAHDRPEVVVGAAFAGGFLLAMILKRLAR